ncbi:MAG: hypothetical protein BKP49_10340 [Treponema sp. CETP13]|nr:MAG: hypothetical protein BKP49_10340 [Treponema sp. CETP13]
MPANILLHTELLGFFALACSFIAAMLAIACFYRKDQLKTLYQLMFFCISLGAWNLGTALSTLVPDTALLPFIEAITYPFVALTALTFFLFCYAHYTEKDHIGYKITLPLFIIPIITIIFSLLYPVTGFFQTFTGKILYNPYRHPETIFGGWFYVHSIYSYALVCLGSILLVIKSSKKETKNRISYILMALISIIYCIQNILVTFGTSFGFRFSTRILHLLLLVIFFGITFYNKKATITYYGKYSFMENINDTLLIFNLKNELIYYNATGKKFFEETGIIYKPYISFPNIFAQNLFTPLGKTYFENTIECYYLQHKDNHQVFYIEKAPIFDKKDTLLGCYLSIKNMKSFDKFTETLEKNAHLDSLCQCSNRALYEEEKNTLLEEAKYPCAVLIADIDDLKTVNDYYGHKTGDEYIKTSYKILQNNLKETEYIYRYKGDEFLIFLQDTTDTKIQTFSDTIKNQCNKQKTEFNFSISIGYSIITNKKESLENHIKIADANMYQQKIRRNLFPVE